MLVYVLTCKKKIKMELKIHRILKITFLLAIALSSILIFMATVTNAVPIGPTLSILSNTTKNATTGAKINSSINGTISPGSYIFTTAINSVQQNTRWKGYVGNVTGTLTLDDAVDDTLYTWTLTTITGEVYSTRVSATINWSGINCTWVADAKMNSTDGASSNRTPETSENAALSLTSKDDNITATFNKQNHTSFTTGTRTVGKNECFSIQTYQRDAAQVFADSATANFTEVILYDGAFNTSNGNVVYETKIENDLTGYRSDQTYDFQMIVPENGGSTWTSSTAYYFYVELT